MNHPTMTTPEDLKALVDATDVTPEYFIREDGTKMAIVNGDFLEKVMVVYSDATISTVGENPGIYDLPLNEE